MTKRTFSIPRETGTHADVLTAAGLADLLASATVEEVRILGDGMTFQVEASGLSSALADIAPAPGYKYLRVKGSVALPAGVRESDAVDYQGERERVSRYYQTREAARKAGTLADPEVLQILDANRPRADWRQFQVLNQLQGFMNTNRVHVMMAGLDVDDLRDQVARGLHALAEHRPSGLDWKTSSVQLFNPNAAKGYSPLKPSGTDRNDKTKEQWTDSFVEWLRYRGYFVVACPYFLGQKGENIRVLCPVPANVSVATLREVTRDLQQAPIRGSAPKLDALAVLHLARTLIEHSEYGQVGTAADDFAIGLGTLDEPTPAQVVSALAITHYQSLGQARAVSELSSLAVPDWFPIASAEDANDWLTILDEHRRALVGLRDDRSDEIGLLVAYRRFLERRGPTAVHALLDFMGAYGAFLVPARERGRRLPAFTTRSLHRVLGGMMEEYVSILENPGFRAVADAIRRSTVSAQWLKSQRQEYREIRYDLLHEIRRKRSLPGDAPLLEIVADFVAAYNYENARRREMGKRAPRNVTTDELEAFTRLVEAKRAPIVGALLAAYGSCRDPRDAEAPPDEPASEMDAEGLMTEEPAGEGEE